MLFILTPDEILKRGLDTIGFDEAKQRKINDAGKLETFLSYYGSAPIVLALIWEDLQTTSIQQARVDPKKTSITVFFMVMYFLKAYPTYNILAVTFGASRQNLQDTLWSLICKIQALKSTKVRANATIRALKIAIN